MWPVGKTENKCEAVPKSKESAVYTQPLKTRDHFFPKNVGGARIAHVFLFLFRD